MFEVSTEREETAYRLGYNEAWVYMLAAISVLMSPMPSRTYRELRSYAINVLWPWFKEETPEIGEQAPAPGLVEEVA